MNSIFADAAAPEFDVMAKQAVRRLPCIDLPLHAVDVGDRREIEMAPPDEGADCRQKLLAEGDVARHGAALGEGGALPGAALLS